MRWRRIVVGLLLALIAGAAVVYLAFPGLILAAGHVAARRGAGPERRSVEVDGQRIVYLDGGQGPTVVLLHGFGASKDAWSGVAADLTPMFRVIVPDLPGFGESPVREGARYDPKSQAERLRAFLDAIGVRDHHLGGLSMGGQIAVMYAAHSPDRVRSLLISGPPGVRSPETTAFLRRALAGEDPFAVHDERSLEALLKVAFFRPPGIPGAIRKAMIQDAIARRETSRRIFDDIVAAGEGVLEPVLRTIPARTLVVWGAEDRMVHPSAVGVYAAGIAKAATTVFPECGHDTVTECPDLLSERYRAFLNEDP